MIGYAAGKLHLVGHDQHRHALLGKAAHHVQHLADQLRIQGGGRLVEVDDLRVQGKASGDCHPLLLAAGELDRVAFKLVRHADPGQGMDCTLSGLFSVDFPSGRQAEGDVFEHRLVQKQVVALKHKGSLLPDPRNLLFGDCVQIVGPIVEGQGSRVRPLKEIDAAQEGRLAGAGGSQDGDHVALLHRQINALEDLLPVKGLAHAVHFQYLHRFSPPSAFSFFSPRRCSQVRRVQIRR